MLGLEHTHSILSELSVSANVFVTFYVLYFAIFLYFGGTVDSTIE